MGAVGAVISVFHNGAKLAGLLKTKQRRRSSNRRTQQQFEEKQLRDSLEPGETQIGLRYTHDLREIGELLKIGDGLCSKTECEVRRLAPKLT